MLQLFFDQSPADSLRFFLQKEASPLLLSALQEIYGVRLTGRVFPDRLNGILEYYFPENFFKSLGFFFGCEDRLAAQGLVYCKLSRLMEKLQDPNTAYIPDLFELKLLAAAVLAAQDQKNNRFFDEDPGAEKNLILRLCQSFDLSAAEARTTARHLLRFPQLLQRDPGDFFHIFPSQDWNLFFSSSFLGGVEAMKSRAGEDLGYGYAAAAALFTDAGIPAPILILGSDTASRLINDLNRQLRAQEEKEITNIRRFLLHPPKSS